MELNKSYTTNKVSKWLNTGEYIMLHHTWPWSDLWLVNYLAYSNASVSCHFVVWKDGVVYQLASLGAITWHAGESKRDGKTDLNKYSIGIEIVSDWHEYNDIQRNSVRELCTYLMRELSLDSDKIIRHVDVAWFRWKRDVGDNFWNNTHKTRKDYQKSYDLPKYTEKEIKNLKLLKQLNSWFWNKFDDTELRNSLHNTNNILESLLE